MNRPLTAEYPIPHKKPMKFFQRKSSENKKSRAFHKKPFLIINGCVIRPTRTIKDDSSHQKSGQVRLSGTAFEFPQWGAMEKRDFSRPVL